MGVQNPYTENMLQAHLMCLKKAGKSLRQIASEDFDNRVTYGDISRALHGEYPKKIDKRLAMGLPPEIMVISIDGPIHPGAQCPGSKQCPIDARWFVPNTPRRKKCYTCSPRRTKKLSDN